MLRSSLLGLLWAGGILAQNNHATGQFHYIGCVEITVPAAHQVSLDPQNCSPEACQEACAGYQYAAVYTETCKCYGDVGSETQLPEEKCDNWCSGDQSKGRCGSCKNDAYANLYGCEEPPQQPASIPPLRTTIVFPPYSAPVPSPAPVPTPAAPKPQPETSTSCVTIVSTPYVPPPSPAGPVQTYGPVPSHTVVVQGSTSKWSSTTTARTRSTWTTSTSSWSKPGYPTPQPQPSSAQPKNPPGYGQPAQPPVQETSVVAQTPGGYDTSGAPVPATPNSGYTSTKPGSHPHSRTTLTGTAGPTATVEAGAGAVSGSLFAVVLALGVAAV